jgi:hypothetical protein
VIVQPPPVRTRPPDRVVTCPGPRGKPWTIHVYYAEHPDPHAWERAEQALVRLLMPKVREIMAQRETAAAERELPVEYTEAL